MLPQQSRQDSDAYWLQRLAVLPPTGPVACEVLRAEPWAASPSPRLAWRNTMTRWLLDVPGGYGAHAGARQADLELLRQTLLATAQGQPLPAAVRIERKGDGPRFAACQARLGVEAPPEPLRLPAL